MKPVQEPKSLLGKRKGRRTLSGTSRDGLGPCRDGFFLQPHFWTRSRQSLQSGKALLSYL
jgi:hypothetical protein